MRNLILFALVVVLGISVSAYEAFSGAPAAALSITQVSIVNAKAICLLGAMVAFLQFSKGDYLRRAWGLLVIGSVCLFEAELVRIILATGLSPETVRHLRDVFVLGSNICTPLAMFFFARALSTAGLDLAGDRRVRWAVTIGFGLIAAAIAGRAAISDLQAFFSGEWSNVDRLVSALGDMVAMVMIAPILYNVLTLRGGALAWPFLLLAVSNVSWLVYDGVVALTGWVGHFGTFAQPLEDGARVTALLFQGVAGLSHYWAVTSRVSSASTQSVARAA